MGVKNDQLVSRRGWPGGINNTSDETALATGRDSRVPAELRDAVNVDLTTDGHPKRRPGYTLLQAGDAHSAWSNDYFPNGYYVRANTLYAVAEDETHTAIIGGLAADLPVSFDRLNDDVLWTNDSVSGLITPELESVAWACECPGGQPLVTVGGGGALSKGVYQVAVTFVDNRGRESGTGLAAMIDVPDAGTLLLDSIPQPTDPNVIRTRIYVTNGNDEILRLHATVPSNITSYVVAQKVDGKPLSTQFLSVLPPGHIVRQFNGRQLVAKGKTLMYSPYLHYGLYNKVNHTINLASKITMVQPIAEGTGDAGVFVADNKRTYFFPGGNPAEWRQVVAYPHGVIPGTAVVSAADLWGIDSQLPVVTWLATNGQVVMGLPGGQVRVIQPKAVADIGESGASYVREEAGNARLVTAISAAQPTGFQVTDNMVVREYRHNPVP